MTEPAVDLTLARFVKLEQRITGAETDGLRARWEFGHELLRARDGKGRLPNGYLARLCGQTGASRSELKYRAQFAERFPTDDELATAVAIFGSWTEIRDKAIKGRAPAKPAQVVPLPEGVFSTIVADPPWAYDNKATRNAVGTEAKYPTMTLDELCALPVLERAAEEAHLYLWTTNGFLRDSFDVMEAWGFEYKTTLVWVKPQLGMGNYFRSGTEYVLFGVRGGLRTLDGNQPNWFQADRGRHSAKPGSFFDLVHRNSRPPYLEMFARRRRLDPDWEYWGNEA